MEGRNARFAPVSRQPSAIRGPPPLLGAAAAGADRPPPPNSPAVAPPATSPQRAAPTWARARSASRSRCRDRGRRGCPQAAISRQPSAVSGPPGAPLDESLRLLHRRRQRVTALDPAQRRDALQRPRRGGQPRHERPDQRPAAVGRQPSAISHQPSAVSRQPSARARCSAPPRNDCATRRAERTLIV